MSVEKYKFISPGIFVSEIDNTGRAAVPEDVGPAIIGRAEKGPILQPTRVNSYFDFVNIFGEPIPGGRGGDVVRDGNYTSPTYGAYAVQAWFRNNAPVTFVRIGGQASEDAVEDAGEAGWSTTDVEPASGSDNGGAFGLFVSNAPTHGDFLTGTITVTETSIASGTLITIQDFLGNSQAIVSGTATDANEFDASGGTEDAIRDGIVESINSGSIFSAATGSGTGVVVVSLLDTSPTLYAGAQFKVSSSAAGLTGSISGVDLNNDTLGNLTASYAAVTGTLAAVWYIDQSASIGLSGSRSDNGSSDVGAGIYFDSVGTNEFKVQISSSNATTPGVLVDTSFNFTDTSEKFIRKAFNTNPILTNNAVVDSDSNSFTRYWLGESFEGAVSQLEGGDTGTQIGVILPLLSGTSALGADFRNDYQNAETGYFFSQDLAVGTSATGSYDSQAMTNLFKLVARNSGDYASRNLKVSISDLRPPADDTADQPYGTFSVLIRKMRDTDNRLEIVEQFNNCNLNPNSENFINKKIGDMYLDWSEEEKRYKQYGDYPNRSKYVYVDMPEEVRLGDTDPRYLPFGVRGPIQFKSFNDVTSSGARSTLVSGNYENYGNTVRDKFIDGAEATNGQVNFDFPQLRLRISASEGSPVDQLNSFYGVDTTFNTSRLDKSTKDHLKIKPKNVSNFVTGDLTETSFDFTLDDICFQSAGGDSDAKFFAYKEGARASSSSRGGLTYLRGTGSYTEVLDNGVDKFTTVFAGGFDGLDITESEPLRTVNYGDNPSTTNNAVFNSVNVAIDSLRDPEVVEYNLAAMPGVINSTLNTKLVDMCESRGDAMAIIDLPGGFRPPEQSVLPASSRRGSVTDVVNNLKTDVINSSYGAAYYPWVQIKDLNNGQVVTVPPSVAAIGALSYSQKVSELWFAPAGFTRGGLSAGRAGLPVVGVKDRLNSRDRDTLYDNRINPIAQFPAEGIVIFGQKTLQIQGSALDRINVRRLLIYLKREISRFAATILFDQNVRTTWNRFRGQVEPFLRGVQAGLGITDFKMVLDETTTTPDLVDRNILYAKIYIKPARAIEFIAVDFILTDSGAAFED